MHSQCQNSADSLAENTTNASKNFSPICLPKPKNFEFLKISSVWVSVVRAATYWQKRYEHASSLIIYNFRKHSDETEMIWKFEFDLAMISAPLWMAKNVWHGTNWRPPGSFAEFCWCRGASDHSGRQWRWSESPFQIHISLQCSEREPFILN